MRIETERLILREIRLEDLDRFDCLFNTDFVTQYLCMDKMTREETLGYIRQMRKKEQDYAIALGDTDELIGKIHVDEDHLRFGVNSMDIAYWLGEPYARQGYMTEALGAAIRYLFAEKGYDAISARVLAPNQASRALLRRLGFWEEGYLHRAVEWHGVIYDDVPFWLPKS